MLVISNRPRAMCSADLKLLTQLPPQLYSTQSSYHHEFLPSFFSSVILIVICFISFYRKNPGYLLKSLSRLAVQATKVQTNYSLFLI